MQGARLRNKPLAADEFADCNEESQLELYLQRQLHEDVARIFDESIYSDLEVVCGKLKVLTHSCILKARTHNFFHKLHTILNVNIDRSTFDEIYSFVSDIYTECDIQHEEKKIITYLERHFHILDAVPSKSQKTKVDTDEPEVFLTPKCVTPYVEKDVQKVINSSPSTELTKEYYALVPIEGNLLDKELNEQDALSNAFYSIIKTQAEGTNPVSPRNKPTSLSLTSSHTSKTVKHSSSCDILNNACLKSTYSPKTNKNQTAVTDQDLKHVLSSLTTNTAKSITTSDSGTEKPLETAYSPDSLVTDEPSSSSDYLSAAYTISVQVNAENNTTGMDNNYTLSDSGLEDTAMLGSASSHNDVTLTNASLSENTLHDLIGDDASISALSMPNSMLDVDHLQKTNISETSYELDCNGTNTSINTEISGKSLKDEKQRQNEEIALLGSSSLSSETGSWESVYPPKFAEKEICEKFLYNERNHYFEDKCIKNALHQPMSPNLIQKSPYKSTACFIDASSLVDEEEVISVSNKPRKPQLDKNLDLPAPSQPVPCPTAKVDNSPLDWSESNENDDSLEQGEKKDPDSIQKDLSPTIFEMTPITEDSLCSHQFDNEIQTTQNPIVESDESVHYQSDREGSLRASSVFMSNTPNNSIMSLKTYRHYESEDSEGTNTVVDSEGVSKKQRNGSTSPPIISGGVSVEDHLPHVGSSHESSPLPKYKIENVPIVTGAYIPPEADNTTTRVKSRTNSSSAWVVDMSTDTSTNQSADESNTKQSDESISERKNIFSMYIDLSEKSTLKGMPARLSSSINTKKNTSVAEKSTPRNSRAASNTVLNKIPDSVTIFEKYESLCNDPNISLSEIISIPEKVEDALESGLLPAVAHKDVSDPLLEKEEPPLIQNLPVQKEIKVESETKDLFVKLSDLDKPVQKPEISLTDDTKELDVRMTQSIPNTNWGDQPFSNNSRSIEVISSFHSENALSLNRLFPHLKNEFSRSMPGSLSSRTRSPLRLGTSSTIGDPEEQVSDNMSEVSSMQSSNCRSGFGNSTTDSQTSSLIENCTSRLGQDLLRMFLEEISPDVIVEVSGKRFKAHKCILSSRCQYFAGILSGGWVESLGNVIVLPPFSYNVVYFALCHIYSGLATIPDSVSIVELATIADMLGLEGLKEAIMFTLKAKYCHHFHKPCSLCIVGVLECFPLSSVYGLDDLYHKCLKWITKHFSKVWPTKAFATLPSDLLDKCYQHHVVNLSIDNFVDTVYGCGITAASLQNSRWAESVARMCRRLLNAAAQFAAPRLVAVLQALRALPPAAPPPARHALHDCLAAAFDWAPPEVVTRAYALLAVLNTSTRNRRFSKPDLISDNAETDTSSDDLLRAHAASWRLQCEGALVRASPRVVTTQAFKELPSDLRKRLRELGCIRYGAHALPATPPLHVQEKRASKNTPTKSNKTSTSTVRNIDIAQVRASFVPYAPKPVVPLGSLDTLRSNNDLRDLKKPMISSHPPKVRTTKAQEERAKFNKTKNTKSQERLNGKSNAGRAPSFENTKPRYLEPKACKEKKTTAVVNKHLPKIESSSESSRNASPIQKRNIGASVNKAGRGETDMRMSQDSLATSSRPRTAEPSTDSLSESINSNKYATYTKVRHTKGSVESIKMARQNENARSHLDSKMKTKIPVYLNQKVNSKSVQNMNSKDVRKRTYLNRTDAGNTKSERKMQCSLMSATKSSSAKIVPKVVKDAPNIKNTSRSQRTTHTSRHQHHMEDKEIKDIPMMERSGTFLKDEPTFGDKTTSIDIDQ